MGLWLWVAVALVLALVYKLRYKIPYYYNVATALRSFVILYRMPQDKIQAFMASYDVYTEDAITPENTHKVVDYYYVLNHLCAAGEIEKMYLPPVMDDNTGILRNQDLYEEKMVKDLGLKRGSRVLDLGCGRGRVAAHVARLVPDSKVSGVNIENSQVENGNEYAAFSGIADRLKLTHGDYNEPLPFDDGTFDGVYEIQAFSLCRGGNFKSLFKEIFRVCKPGGRVCFCDWVKLAAFNENDPRHNDLHKRCKLLIGAVYTPSPEDYIAALEAAGFKMVLHGVPGVNAHQYKMVERAHSFFMAMWSCVKVLVALHIVPAYFNVLFERFNKDGTTLTDGDRENLWSTVYQVVAEKPAH
eukprot:TRINITY_DN743_c0_g2_i1.p2 TRINITY_DN743_c0_g2~~TRINITY_DN743_c0_g2_i1.p2  ORF type:complete len:356 (-),score=99.23 TRINITY_DN743_c0_g2_i1:54-1121(-)